MTAEGFPCVHSTISKIEYGQRRVLAIIDIDTTDLATFKALVNKELAFLRRVTGTSPPS